MRWPALSVLVLGLTAVLATETRASGGAFSGVSLYGGKQYQNDPIWHVSEDFDWQDFQLRLLVGKHQTDRADLWLEVTVGSVDWDQDIPDSIEVGAMAMTSYDVLVRKGWRLFTELGGGFGWMTDTPDTSMVFAGPLGLLDYGFGIKVKMKNGLTVKLGPRFHHRSAMMKHDTGMNCYGIMLSVMR